MSLPLPPLPSAAGGAALPLPGVPGVPAVPVAAPAAATGGAQPVPPAPPVPLSPPAPPATTNARWSAEMLQNLRLQAFEQLVAQLARQVQASPNAPAPQWPADGVSEALGRMLQTLLEQMGAQQGRPLQMLAAQPGSAALLQALAAANPPAPGSAASAPTAPASAQIPASTTASVAAAAVPAPALAGLVATAKAPGIDALLSAGTTAAAAQAPRGSAPPASQGLPPLQNWWVQQGTLVTPQGERGFMLSLQVPQAWAQAQLAATVLSGAAAMAQQGVVAQAGLPAVPLAAGLMAGPPAASGQAPGAWRLPLDVPLQALASGPVAVVLQPRDEPQLRTSALLLLEFQPLRQAQLQAQALPAMPFTALPPAMAQEMQQLLQNRGDPWLQMAVAQNAGAVPREHRGHQSHLCNTAGCQYEGRAPCAQPFCSEMNRLWGVARAERRL